MKLSGRGIFSLLIVIAMIIFIVSSLEYNPKARMIPLAVGIMVLVMSLLQFLVDLIPSLGKKLPFVSDKGMLSQGATKPKFDSATLDEPTLDETIQSGANQPVTSKQDEPEDKDERWSSVFLIFLCLLGFVLLLQFTTYLIAVSLFVFLFIWLMGKEKVTSALAVAVGLGICMYALFGLLLGTTF
jgi:hypothetical protein